MSQPLQRALALWAALLSAALCLVFLPISRPVAIALTVCLWAGIAGLLFTRRRTSTTAASSFWVGTLPPASYRQPVMLVCGDTDPLWQDAPDVQITTTDCRIRVAVQQDVAQVVRELLQVRPGWGTQLAVMLCICPQQHTDTVVLTGRLLSLRGQLSQGRRETGGALPLVLCSVVSSSLTPVPLWQALLPGGHVSVWSGDVAHGPVSSWMAACGPHALSQQVLINSLSAWCQRYVTDVLGEVQADFPAVSPSIVLWGGIPFVDGSLSSSLWTRWLREHTALQRVAGWQPAANEVSHLPALPDFILSSLPGGHGLTARQQAGRSVLRMFLLAAVVALCSSAWNNHQLMQRLAADMLQYVHAGSQSERRAAAVKQLQQDASQLDDYARDGEPLRLGLGMYRGERLYLPVLDTLRGYTPQIAATSPEPRPVTATPSTVRLDSLSLFDTGSATLKPGSTNVLVNALVGIKAKPGWLIVVSGHTDNTGSPVLNQTLSLKRAEAVRDWMRDTGGVPESCFAVQGYGATRPLQSNNTTAGRAANRRVEIRLVPQADACRVPGIKPVPSQDGGASQHQ
ncbi:OmpA family protein [Serratia marcescens]|uniref:OmpA family protein n=1 Tax=Serratia marcescens TaxID=615 RepID=UPI0024C49C44|nr:OmpA family protein [Serratia marcescens]MDK1711584.1 OmpA family protein [Serratia marcescens]